MTQISDIILSYFLNESPDKFNDSDPNDTRANRAQMLEDQFAKKFERNRNEYLAEKERFYSTYGRNLKTIYINGEGRSGKSYLALNLARLVYPNEEVFKASANVADGLTYDLFQNYDGQRATIANDLDPDALNYSRALGMFDPHEYVAQISRVQNAKWLSDLMFVTYTKSATYFCDTIIKRDFHKNVVGKNGRIDKRTAVYKDKMRQLSKRLGIRIEVNRITPKHKTYTVKLVDSDYYDAHFTGAKSFPTRLVKEFDCDDIFNAIKFNKLCCDMLDFMGFNHSNTFKNMFPLTVSKTEGDFSKICAKLVKLSDVKLSDDDIKVSFDFPKFTLIDNPKLKFNVPFKVSDEYENYV